MNISKKGIVKICHAVLPSLKSRTEQVEQTKMVWINYANVENVCGIKNP